MTPPTSSTGKALLTSARVPLTKGPYGHGVTVRGGTLVFTSGLTGRGADGAIVAGGITAQTRQTFANLEAVLAEAGATLDDVVRMTVFITDDAHYEGMNAVRRELFTGVDFVSSTIICALHARDALVEVELTAVVGDERGEAGDA